MDRNNWDSEVVIRMSDQMRRIRKEEKADQVAAWDYDKYLRQSFKE